MVAVCICSPAGRTAGQERARDRVDVEPLGHVAYAIGGGLGTNSGLRQNIDLALEAGFLHDAGQGGFFSRAQAGWFLGGSVATGFGAYPSYAAAELGWTHLDIGGTCVAWGPALRFAPSVRPGGSLRIGARLLIAQLGARLLAVSDGDVQVTATIGAALE